MNCFQCKYVKSRDVIKTKEEYLKEYYCENNIVVKKFTDIQKKLSEEVPAFKPFLAAVGIPRPDFHGCPYFERKEETRKIDTKETHKGIQEVPYIK